MIVLSIPFQWYANRFCAIHEIIYLCRQMIALLLMLLNDNHDKTANFFVCGNTETRWFVTMHGSLFINNVNIHCIQVPLESNG